MSNGLLLIVQLIATLLRNLKDQDDCPDGLCDEPLAKAEELAAKLGKPTTTVSLPVEVSTVGFGFFDLFKLAQCVPVERIFAVVAEVRAILAECDRCPDGECSFLDLLTCVDLDRVVGVVKEILSIVEDSRICIDGDNEITLGEAAA